MPFLDSSLPQLLAGDLCDKVSTSLGDLNTVADKITVALTAITMP